MDNKSYLQVPGRERLVDSHNDRLGGSCCSINNNSHHHHHHYHHHQHHHTNNINNSSSSHQSHDTSGCWRQDDYSNDKYTAAIELSNKCREFYKSRLEAANNMKSKWRDNNGSSECQYATPSTSNSNNSDETTDNSTSSPSTSLSSSSSSPSSSTEVNDNDSKFSKNKRQRNSIDQAMEKLRAEMVSLMDQDLSLMKQLLTLNETIEELKWQRQYYSCSTSCASLSTSKNLDSNWSVSDTEMYDSEDDFMAAKHASCSSVQMGHVTGPTWHSTRKARRASKDFEKIPVDTIAIRVENVEVAQPASSTTKDTVSSSDTMPYGDNKKLTGSGGGGKDRCVNVPRFTSDHHVITNGPIIIRHERDQDSFDSGIHEPTSSEELIWNV